MRVEIRTATADDAGDIARVHVDSFLENYRQFPTTHRSASTGFEGRMVEWSRLLDAGDSALVADVDGRVDGFVRFGTSPDDGRVGHIFSIHVSPGAAGKGTGTRLMETAVRSLGETGFPTATLWVVSANTAARRFYERLGWRHDGIQRREKLAFGDEDGDAVDVVRYSMNMEGEG